MLRVTLVEIAAELHGMAELHSALCFELVAQQANRAACEEARLADWYERARDTIAETIMDGGN